MTVSYLLTSSAYRNRLLYPNPADYILQLGNSQSLQQNVFHSTNPISIGLPDYNFCWTNFNHPTEIDRFEVTITSGTALSPIIDSSLNQSLLGLSNTPVPSLSLKQRLENCYGILKYYVLFIPSMNVIRDIENYDPVLFRLTLRNPIPNFDLTSGPITAFILNPSQNVVSPPDSPINVLEGIYVNGFFLERSSTVYLDYEISVYNITLNEIRTVRQYQKTLGVFNLCDTFSDKWTITDQYWVLSRSKPLGIGEILEFANGQFYHSSFIEEYQWVRKGREYIAGELVTLQTESLQEGNVYRVLRVDQYGSILDIELVSLSHIPYSRNQILNLVPERSFSSHHYASIQVITTSLAFHCQFTSPLVQPESLKGNYFMPVLTSPQYTFEENQLYLSPNATIPVRNSSNQPIGLLESQSEWGVVGIRKVIPLTTCTAVLLVQPMYHDKLKRFDIVQANQASLPSYFTGCLHFIIPSFYSEGVVPLNFTGTQLTQSQMSCYEVSIISLILPNQEINGTQGLLTSAYPYVFVELSNETMPSGHNRSIIYSNNPSAVRSTFVCSISDVNNPRTTRFIKINSDGAKQIMKFSPFDNLRVRVSLPNGQTFETEETDLLVPNDPDQRLQISIVFEIRRL